ncbi:MAG: biopolymer transporter ExbD [Gammaproteobacteria bacterium]|nr:biopolymer transporter ExbD [Gammaproteobacteria bacterium]
MQFRAKRTEEPEINLIPLIDVLLMTLIFLLMTTSFSKEAQLRLQLPSAHAQSKPQAATLRIVIDAGGQYFIGGKALLNTSESVLRQAMAEAAGAQKNPVVIIEADRRTPEGAVVEVMDVARQLGFVHLTFATQKASGGSTP